MEGIRGEESIANLCRREGMPNNLYFRWSKDFLEAGKKRLAGDNTREVSSHEVVDLKKEKVDMSEILDRLNNTIPKEAQ